MKAINSLKPITVFILLALLLNINCVAQMGEEKQSLRGRWQFTLGDNMKFADPNYDDSDWESIHVPSTWENEGFRNYDGYAWYRKTVEIDFDENNDPIFLHLGRIDDVDEVYFNGELIGRTGSFPPDFFTAYNQNRTYTIPAELINKNEDNLIAVRVYDARLGGGITGFNIGLYKFNNFNRNSIQLVGRWKFHLSDDMNWAKKNFDDSDWDDILVPSDWESQGFRNYDGYAWYRKTFEVPSKLSTENSLLILGKIDDLDEVFVNGVKVGSTGNMRSEWAEDGEWEKTRTYFISEDILKPGQENVVAIRVYDVKGRGGIYEGPVTIIDARDYKDFWRDYHKNNYDFPRWIWTYFED